MCDVLSTVQAATSGKGRERKGRGREKKESDQVKKAYVFFGQIQFSFVVRDSKKTIYMEIEHTT